MVKYGKYTKISGQIYIHLWKCLLEFRATNIFIHWFFFFLLYKYLGIFKYSNIKEKYTNIPWTLKPHIFLYNISSEKKRHLSHTAHNSLPLANLVIRLNQNVNMVGLSQLIPLICFLNKKNCTVKSRIIDKIFVSSSFVFALGYLCYTTKKYWLFEALFSIVSHI